jgi:ABC-2 type transport system ATP-binding protein
MRPGRPAANRQGCSKNSHWTLSGSRNVIIAGPRGLAVMSSPPPTSQVQVPAIHLRGLEKSYKELRVLRGVDFKADTGTAQVNGFDVARQAADVRESISLTGQFAAVDEILSGRENLVLVARLRRLKDPGAIADELLRRFSLTEAGTRRVATYSGGMRRPS